MLIGLVLTGRFRATFDRKTIELIEEMHYMGELNRNILALNSNMGLRVIKDVVFVISDSNKQWSRSDGMCCN